jgi:mannose/fructose/N-acetylgalactosamine-specific phosphotransferase system component IIC
MNVSDIINLNVIAWSLIGIFATVVIYFSSNKGSNKDAKNSRNSPKHVQRKS